MPYEPLYERFPEISVKETRSITIRNSPFLPDDDYGFLEAYCNEENCDCRRVMFFVASRKRNKFVAVIAYGWESKAFYAKWYKGNDPDIAQEMQGPVLNPGSEQSELAPALLEVVRGTLLKDPAYINRLKQHYWMFKKEVDPDHFKQNSFAGPVIQPAAKAKKHHRHRSK